MGEYPFGILAIIALVSTASENIRPHATSFAQSDPYHSGPSILSDQAIAHRKARYSMLLYGDMHTSTELEWSPGGPVEALGLP